MVLSEQAVKEALRAVPEQFRGAGGAVVVLSEGSVVGRRVWGFSDLENCVPMTAHTLVPICSISKQFFCGLLVHLETLPVESGGFGPDLREKMATLMDDYLPAAVLEGRNRLEMLEQLCDNKSGLRDYWGLTTLWGAHPEGVFSLAEHGPAMRKRIGGYHFSPGTEFSYCNTNFHIVGRLLEAATGEALNTLLERHIFDPASMKTARLCPDFSADVKPDPCVGYEGDEARGWVPAVNRIQWSGDAGIAASLNDMAAYEAFLDQLAADKNSWYARALDISGWHYDDVAHTPSTYRRGLVKTSLGKDITVYGHGGALRGFRLHRIHCPEKRLSVVTLLNHGSESSVVAVRIMRMLVGLPPVTLAPANLVSPVNLMPVWLGVFYDADTHLHITVTADTKPGHVHIAYGWIDPHVRLIDADHAVSDSGNVDATLIDPDHLKIVIKSDNRTLDAHRLPKHDPMTSTRPFRGTYRCEEIDSVFHIGVGGASEDDLDTAWLYGSFDGFLGKGQARPMRPVGQDVWVVSCPRGMDAPAPGDWTATFSRDAGGGISEVTLGCWISRKLVYKKV